MAKPPGKPITKHGTKEISNVKLAIRNREDANFILSICLVIGAFVNICLYTLCVYRHMHINVYKHTYTNIHTCVYIYIFKWLHKCKFLRNSTGFVLKKNKKLIQILYDIPGLFLRILDTLMMSIK